MLDVTLVHHAERDVGPDEKHQNNSADFLDYLPLLRNAGLEDSSDPAPNPDRAEKVNYEPAEVLH